MVDSFCGAAGAVSKTRTAAGPLASTDDDYCPRAEKSFRFRKINALDPSGRHRDESRSDVNVCLLAARDAALKNGDEAPIYFC
jgi:hypothetical protein